MRYKKKETLWIYFLCPYYMVLLILSFVLVRRASRVGEVTATCPAGPGAGSPSVGAPPLPPPIDGTGTNRHGFFIDVEIRLDKKKYFLGSYNN